jgi:DNA polymerase V
MARPNQADGGTVRVPLMAQDLCAGFPSPADDFIEEGLDLPLWLVPNPPATFIWQVAGDCMTRAGVFDRDLVVVDRSVDPRDRALVVAVVAGEVSLKRYRSTGGRTFLTYDDPRWDGVRVAPIEGEIWGVVLFSIRWHDLRALGLSGRIRG